MTSIAYGDRVAHPSFPEWGSGSVIKVENTAIKGNPTRRITVRFSHGGLKIFTGDDIPLDLVASEYQQNPSADVKRPAIAEVEDLERSGLTQAIEQKLLEIMHAIPLACRDPFNNAEHRLKKTFDLYKYDLSGRGLMEWAMFQTGMDDPLTRFNRTELEMYFKQFAHDRDAHLSKLLAEMRDDPVVIKRLLAEAPVGAKRMVTKLAL